MLHIEKRLEKLERKIRLYQFAFVSIILLGGLITITAFKKNTVPDLIQAKEFQVVDDDGKVFVSIKKGYGSGDIAVYNLIGTDIIHLLKSDAGTGVILTRNGNGNFACRLAGYTDGGGKLEIYNSKDKIADEIGYNTADAGYVALSSENGNKMIEMTSSNSGNGVYNSYDDKGNNIIIMGGTSQHDGTINFFNRNRYKICALGGDDNANGALNIYNSYGQNQNGVWPK
jgi:hypothetical protein